MVVAAFVSAFHGGPAGQRHWQIKDTIRMRLTGADRCHARRKNEPAQRDLRLPRVGDDETADSIGGRKTIAARDVTECVGENVVRSDNVERVGILNAGFEPVDD